MPSTHCRQYFRDICVLNFIQVVHVSYSVACDVRRLDTLPHALQQIEGDQAGIAPLPKTDG